MRYFFVDVLSQWGHRQIRVRRAVVRFATVSSLLVLGEEGDKRFTGVEIPDSLAVPVLDDCVLSSLETFESLPVVFLDPVPFVVRRSCHSM